MRDGLDTGLGDPALRSGRGKVPARVGTEQVGTAAEPEGGARVERGEDLRALNLGGEDGARGRL
ncbi:hypothetical protein ACFVTZ_05835 [Cellulosimicrobium cellulans]|uniref:hypothetical protein n=1 Tax=Cellulosimicrobium cellulans TaxID=1710 RepID=UPI0036E3AAC5